MKNVVLQLFVLVGFVRVASAYPQYQLSRETTCTSCHVSTGGGGLLDSMGEATASDINQFPGDPRFLHGAVDLPSWLLVGGDFRAATGMSDRGAGPAFVVFPMQMELAAAVTKGPVTVMATAGTIRPDEDKPASILLLREHWLQWKSESSGWSVRAGRFAPVYGQRNAEHNWVSRRYGGAPLYGETYSAQLAWIDDTFEAHVTGFVADRWFPSAERGDGAALYAETRLRSDTAVGVMARFAASHDEHRSQGGVVVKRWWEGPRLLLAAEGQLVKQSIRNAAVRSQWLGQLVATKFLSNSMFLDVGIGHFEPNVAMEHVGRTAVDVNLHWFTWSHLELIASARAHLLGLGSGGPTTGYGLLQVHYRL